LSYIEETKTPKIAAKEFFNIVDILLNELAERENWVGIFTEKKTCSRVIINSELHVDVPLYSIPDNEFHTISEAATRAEFSFSQMHLDDYYQEWASIKDRVLLAHRTIGWKPSDPRKLNTYFTQAFLTKGEQLRRICRYLKGWRDFRWDTGGPSSICLMIIADELYTPEFKNRDDLCLLAILKKIPNALMNPVLNPADKTEPIDLQEDVKRELKNQAVMFSTDLERAINEECFSSQYACKLIQMHLGRRFPIRDDLSFDVDIRNQVLNTPIISNISREPEKKVKAG
jgi:hypothetical protein